MAQMAISPRRFPLRQLLLNRPPWTAWWLLLTGFEPQRRRDRMGEHDGERHQQNSHVTGTGQLAGNPISMAANQQGPLHWANPDKWLDTGWQRKSLGAERMATCSFDRSTAPGLLLLKQLQKIGEISPSTVIHCTFLDPYLSFHPVLPMMNTGKTQTGSDCYLTQDWTGGFTRGKLAHAHNVDVGWLDPNKKTVAYGSGQVAFSVTWMARVTSISRRF